LNKKMVLSATLENLEPFQDHVRSSALICGLDGKQLQQIELAVEEVLVNVIRYAYPEDHQGKVEVDCSWGSGPGLSIEVTDYGIAFDPLAEADPDTSLGLAERSIGGLGIFLTKKMMDQVCYERKDNKNILTMVKNKE
jgi:serine/threonine-protein kinase RsbW